jgi:hypothetical protein
MNNKYICVRAYPGVPKGSIAVDFGSVLWARKQYNILYNGDNLGYYREEYFKNNYWKDYYKVSFFKKLYTKILNHFKKNDQINNLLNCDIEELALSKESIRDPEINKSCVFKAGEIFNIGFDIGYDKVVGDIIEIDYYKCRVLECNHKDLIHKVKIIK